MKIDLSKNPAEPSTSPKMTVKRNVTNQEAIDELRKVLMQDGFDMIFQEKVSPIQIKIDQRGVVISISSGFLFEHGSTEISPETYPVIEALASVMDKNPRLIAVEGHTDDQPIVGSLFYSNWELSALRATSMVRLLTQNFKLDPTRFTASGYGSFRPVAPNDTEASRAQNRRVEIIMLNASKISDMQEDEGIPR